MERIFGYHNWPGLQTGTVMIHDGPMMAAAGNFSITLRGKAAHAAMPNLGADPVQGAAHLIIALNAIVARNIDPLETAVISTCKLAAGNANNQIPETAVIGGTVRALKPKVMEQLLGRMRDVAAHTAAAFGLTAEMENFGYLPPTTNDKTQAEFARDVAAGLGMSVRSDMAPTMGAEDFGRFLLEIPGAYAWIGNGDSAGLHNPYFNYNDEILPLAAGYLAGIAKAALA
jgi:hippurate hydrolase